MLVVDKPSIVGAQRHSAAEWMKRLADLAHEKAGERPRRGDAGANP